MSLEYRVGDCFERMAEIPDGSIDVVITSPPFLALRSYLPADHPLKHREIGSEATPAAFLDTLLALSAEWGRVLAPHGSLCVELGDTYSGSGGGGGDYLPGGLREDQPGFGGSAERQREGNAEHWRQKNAWKKAGDAHGTSVLLHPLPDPGWPLAKSLTGIPTLYPWSLAYGRNLLTGHESPAGQWRIRNVIVWARPNPPVGALGDKFRPATSYITVACRGARRYFDLDAVRGPYSEAHMSNIGKPQAYRQCRPDDGSVKTDAGGAPPLDWHTDNHPEDGDWLWKMATQPYAGSHYATFPMALPKRLIDAMCPLRVCTVCGLPSERIVEAELVLARSGGTRGGKAVEIGNTTTYAKTERSTTTLGWSDCGHDAWRTGRVLDPFAGSGTTLEAAQAVGRHAIGIDLDARNGDLARSRVGMFLDIDGAVA